MLQEGMLDVGNGHSIYWCSHGNRDAPAVVILHSGPGGAINLEWGKFFDPQLWHMIFFDQRGCGKSTPFGELRHNDLPSLVDDMEHLRTSLGIDRWALFGGSWGTTLALVYGAVFPGRCLGFLLGGIFLARQEDIDWFLWDVRRIFPDKHTLFLDAIASASGRRPHNVKEILTFTGAPLARFDQTAVTLAHAWNDYEAALAGITSIAAAAATPLKLAGNDTPAESTASAAISTALLERHYMADKLPPPIPLLLQVPRIAHLPCYIVHGRADMICPSGQAYALAQAWPKAQLSLVDGAGHSIFAQGNAAALRRDAQLLRRDLGRHE